MFVFLRTSFWGIESVNQSVLFIRKKRIPLLLVHDGVGPLLLCFFDDIEVKSEVVKFGGFDAGVTRGAADDGHVEAGGEDRSGP